MAQESRKSELIAQLAQARQGASTSLRGLRRDLDLAQRVETAFQRHRFAWLGGAGLLGFLAARLPARRPNVPVKSRHEKPAAEEKVIKAGMLVTLLKIAFDLARPALTKWLTRRVTAYAEERFSARRG